MTIFASSSEHSHTAGKKEKQVDPPPIGESGACKQSDISRVSGASGQEKQQPATSNTLMQGEQYGGRRRGGGAQNTGIMEIKSHPCSADPRHIELSRRLIHTRDSRHPTLSGIKVAVGDEQLALTTGCGSAL